VPELYGRWLRPATLVEKLLQERSVDRILRPVGVFGSKQCRGAGDRHADAAHVVPLHVRSDFGVRQATGTPHQGDNDLVDHPDHDVAPEIIIIHIGDSVVGQYGQALLHQRHVLGRVVNEKVDVLGESARAVGEDRPPPIST
jgi:hypothetical protein